MKNSIFTKPIISVKDTQQLNNKTIKTSLSMSQDGNSATGAVITEHVLIANLDCCIFEFQKRNGIWFNTNATEMFIKNDELAIKNCTDLTSFYFQGKETNTKISITKNSSILNVKVDIVIDTEIKEPEEIEYKVSFSDNGKIILVNGMYVKHNRKHFFTKIYSLDENNVPELIVEVDRDQIDGCDILSLGESTISPDGDLIAISYLLKREEDEGNVMFIYNNVLKNKPNTKFMGKSKCCVVDLKFNPTSISFNKEGDKIILGNSFTKGYDCDELPYPLNRPFVVLGLLSNGFTYTDAGIFILDDSTRQLLKLVFNI